MKVFISHSSHDRWVAGQISRLLEADGHTTFLDEKDIRTGDSIDASIQEHLRDSDHLVILLSPASITSHWVFIEVGGARALGKKIIPITLHLGANEIPTALSQLRARDINELDRYLAEIRTPGVEGASHPREEPARGTKRGAWRHMRGSDADADERSPGAELRIGDRVRIVEVERLTEHEKAKDPKWVPAMDKFSGVETWITDFPEEQTVSLDADEGVYLWNTSWLAKLD
jgi:hypothetical protein